MEKAISNINKYLLLATIFIFPFFFLPITQEFYVTNKMYLLIGISVILLSLSVLRFAFIKRLSWKKTPFDASLFLFLITIALSIIIASPNKIEALLNQSFGFLFIFALVVIYFYTTRTPQGESKKDNKILYFLSQLTPIEVASFSALLLSITSIIFFLNPLKDVKLPYDLQFLKAPGFTPIGSIIDLAVFLGFFLIIFIAQAITQKTTDKSLKSNLTKVFSVISVLVVLIAFTLTIAIILKPNILDPKNNQNLNVILPPFGISWYSAVEILKAPLTALFGVGVDNFTTIFTRVKDANYSLSNLWQISSFTVSRSAILHIFTETGIFGLAALTLLIMTIFKEIGKITNKVSKQVFFVTSGYLLLVLLFLPPSLPIFFLLFLTFSVLANREEETRINENKNRMDSAYVLPIYLGIVSFSIVIIGFFIYFLSQSYIAEVYFKKSLNAGVNNDVKTLYNFQRQAILTNPHMEKFRINFTQTNLWVANNLASKNKDQVTDQDKKTISDAIQTAIAEAKAIITLNPQKATGWATLAEIYRSIMAITQGADVWTVSAYQRAIIADPQNPVYRFNLGGVYFSLNAFDDASKLFEQAVAIKPDWANAHYNLAWTYYKKSDFQRAVTEMQNTMNLIDPRSAKIDYDKAKTDFEEFKKKLPKAENTTQNQQTQQNQNQIQQLALPTTQPTAAAPIIQLPQEASPEAR